MAQRQIFKNLTNMAARKPGGVLCQTSHSFLAMSCSHKKLLWRPTSGVRWRWLIVQADLALNIKCEFKPAPEA